MSYRYSLFIAAVLAVASQILTRAADAQTFSNTAPITIPSIGTATPYPSSITVSGAPTAIGYLSVTLSGFSHSWVNDVNVLLVSPTGQKTLLMANCNGSGIAGNITLTFIPDGTATLPSSSSFVASGVYACSVYSPTPLPAPAPAWPYGTSLAPLIGTNPNGTWNLYVWDDTFQGNGTFSGGWSITFNQTIVPFPVTTAFTYQGVLSADDTPINGNANVRFTLFNSEIAGPGANIGPSITRSFTGISGGKITSSLDFGSAVDVSQALWLSIEVESPPGSGFVALSPRQPITPTPQARVAQFATNAANANNANNADNANNANNATTASSAPWSGLTGQAAVSTAAIGTGWQMLFNNSASGSFRGGVRLADSGFLELTNNAAAASPSFARLNSSGVWTAVSDERLKTDVTTAEGNLTAALRLRPVNFRWKADGTPDFGLIAQEVRRVFPALVTGDEAAEPLTMNYGQLSVVAIGAIQELKSRHDAQLEALKSELKKREVENAELKARLERLERTLQKP